MHCNLIDARDEGIHLRTDSPIRVFAVPWAFLHGSLSLDGCEGNLTVKSDLYLLVMGKTKQFIVQIFLTDFPAMENHSVT